METELTNVIQLHAPKKSDWGRVESDPSNVVNFKQKWKCRDGQVLYASDDSPESIQEARDYIKREQFTSDDVRLVKRDDQTLVIAKRPPASWQPN